MKISSDNCKKLKIKIKNTKEAQVRSRTKLDRSRTNIKKPVLNLEQLRDANNKITWLSDQVLYIIRKIDLFYIWRINIPINRQMQIN